LFHDVKAIIFDLDGTLYSSDALAKEIKESANRYIASLKSIDVTDAGSLIENTRNKLSGLSGMETTLTETCLELGGDIHQLHAHFAAEINPELYLGHDEQLVTFLEMLAKKFDLYIYTNNNRNLCGRIMKSLGITGCFSKVFTIEDYWQPKPDISALKNIFARTGKSPAECLFVGDRYDIDLRLPVSLGCPVFLVSSTQGLVFPLKSLVNEENIT
jgi:putative hydrolase of the HAD superfamily